jgi:transmembrane sensor
MRVVAVACGAVIALAWLWSSSGVAEYRAGPGDQITAALVDGSRVRLNTRTHIRARLSASSRDVELLEGEALFKVAKDAHRPFRVFVKGSEIRAVGTEFNVYRQRDVTTVTVLEGQVEVMHASPSVPHFLPRAPDEVRAASLVARLSPRQQAAVALDGAVLRMGTVDVSRVTAWTQALLRFSGETLGEVVEQFNRYNTLRMVLEDPSLAEVRVSGVFSPTDVDSFLAYLMKHTEHVTTEESGGVIHVVREGRSSTDAPEVRTVPDSVRLPLLQPGFIKKGG